jgi:transposase
MSRGQVVARLANVSACLVGVEPGVGAHHLSRQLLALGHDVKLVPAAATNRLLPVFGAG